MDGRQEAGARKRRQSVDAIAEAAEALIFATLREGRGLSSLSLRAFAAAANRSPSTVSAAFGSTEAIFAEVATRLKTKGQVVPEAVQVRARSHVERQLHNADPRRGWRLRLQHTPPSDLKGRLAIYTAAAAMDPLRRAEAACALSEAYLNTSDGASNALLYAEECLLLCKGREMPVTFMPIAMEAARLAATASRYLSRTHPSQDLPNLVRVRGFKNQEAEYASAMQMRVAAAMATFHSRRADALITGSRSNELAALNDVVAALRDLRSQGQTIPDDCLATVATRVECYRLAYPNDPAGSDLNAARELLMHMFQRATRSTTRRELESLFKVTRHATELDAVAPQPTDLLQAWRYGVVGMLGLAKYLLHLAEHPNAMDLSAVLKEGNSGTQQDQLRTGAATILLDICNNTTRRGSAGKLRLQAKALLDELQAGGVEPDSHENRRPVGSFDKALSEIEALVVALLIGETLDRKQIAKLIRTLQPIVTFLSRPTGDAAAHTKNGCAENHTVSFGQF